MIRLIGVYLQLCLVVHLANAQHQLAFGIHTGQQVRRQQQEERRAHHHDEAPLSSSSSSSSSSLSPSDLHHYALTLLSQITQHSTLSSHTPQTPYLPQSYLTSNTLESNYFGGPNSTRSRVFQKCLELLERVYGGKKESREDRKRSGKLDYSIRGVVLGLKGLVEKFNNNNHQNKSSGSTGSSSLGSRDARNWRERLEKLNLATGIGGGGLNEEETRQGMQEVVKLMRDAGERGNGDSLNWLGDLNLFGHLTVPVNTSASTEFYTLANEKNGNVESQYKLGFLYGTNYDHAFEGSGGKGQQGSALLHYTFSALSGHVPSSMTVGYRHWAGIGTKQSCKDALPWYKSAAESAIRSFNSGPPGGLHLPPIKLRLSDLNGGVYGPSSGSSKPLILSTGGSTAQSLSEWKDLIEFHQFHAEKGDQVYMFRLARLFYGGFSAGGLGGIRSFESSSSRLSLGGLGQVKDGMWDGGRDFGKSFRWFSKVCKKVWSGDGKEALWDVDKFGPYNSGSGGGGAARDARSSSTPMTKKSSSTTNSVLGYYDSKLDKKNDKLDDQTLMVSGLAAGYLGRMYLRGEGVQVNFQKAFLWFKRGTTRGDRESHNGLGVMYRDGLGVERNLKTSLLHFHTAAQQDLAEAQVNLGKYHFGLGDRVLATTFFEAAIRTDGIRQPDTFQAYYYLAELASTNDQSGSGGAAGGDNCPVTVSFYKHVAERGDWDHEVWWEAERARDRGDLRKALLGYWIMAERGYEVAQNNVAWILDRDKSRIRVPLLDKAPIGSNETDRIALTYWTRSAAQDNVDALVKLGDYYFKGIGTTSTSASTSASSSLGSLEKEEEEEEKDDSNRRRGEELGGPQFEKAATFYQSAATSRLSAMAMWNLGWMHETGQGVPQDFHLAKRYLDSALETSPSAYFPSTLSLISLYTRALYHVIFSPSSSSEEMNALSLFGKDPSTASSDDLQREKQEKGFVPQGGWGFGRAWRDIQRSWGIDPGPEPEVIPLRSPTGANTGGNNNPGENQAQNNHETRNGGQEPWESAQQEAIINNNNNNKRQPRRVGEDEEDDEFFIGGDEDDGDLGGTVAIIALCMLLAWLVYFRQRPRDNQNQNRQAPVAAPVPGQTPAPPQQAQATPPTRAREEEEEPRRLV
ncbi:hypothetical protein JCM3765_005531 [Sporobolomyces pararoseus]